VAFKHGYRSLTENSAGKFLKSNKKIYLRAPPPINDFTSLFRFMWDHGVGNRFDRGDNPRPWNDISLENAFDALHVNLDRRTIQNWLSGKNIPTRRNLFLLSRIVSADDENLKRKWAEAFIAARAQSKRAALTSTKQSGIKNEVLSEPIVTDVATAQSAPDVTMFKTRIKPLAAVAVAALALVFFVNILYGQHQSKPSKELSNNPIEKTIAVLPFKDLSAAQDQSFFSIGISEEIVNSLAQVSEFRVKSSTASFAFGESLVPIDEIADQLGANYFVEGAFQKNGDYFRLTARLVKAVDGELIWSTTYKEKTAEIFSTQERIAVEIAKALDIYLDDEQRLTMFSFGTRDVQAYEHYLKGRYLLKGWHESSKNQDLVAANSEFNRAVEADPTFAKAYFHSVDIYYHLAKGDLSKVEAAEIVSSPVEARDKIQDLLSLAQQHATNNSDRAQYKVNQIFFSDDWTGLKQAAIEFATLAIKGRGELEWEFGPVALLLTGETQLMRDLADQRILKYDPLNGTGHSYAVRAYLLEGDYGAAQTRLLQAQTTTFSNRLDEVKGYLLYSEGDLEALKMHAQTAEYLSPLLREYFAVLADSKNAGTLLETGLHLQGDEINHSLAMWHSGRTVEGGNEINRILKQPLGTVLFPVMLAYGAGCGPASLPQNDRLEQRFSEAGIESIPCIRAEG